MYLFHPAILAVSRQTNLEAGQIMKHTIRTFQGWCGSRLFERNGLPAVAKDDNARRVRYCRPKLILMLDTESDHGHLSISVFAGDGIKKFYRILRQHVIRSPLLVAITDEFLTTKSIRKLLEPFDRVLDLNPLKFTGPVWDKYKHRLSGAMWREIDTNTAFQKVQDTMEQGDQAFINKEYSIAIAKYEEAGLDCAELYSCRAIEPTILNRSRFKGQTVQTACIQTMTALATKCSTTDLKMKNPTWAREWFVYALK